jgi:hypothetical protein
MKRWQYVVNLLLALWMVISPFMLGYLHDGRAMIALCVLGATLLAFVASGIALPQRWDEPAMMAIGLVTLLAPGLMQFHAPASWNAQIVGACVALVSAGPWLGRTSAGSRLREHVRELLRSLTWWGWPRGPLGA